MERRRRLASGGLLPPQINACFTQGERAVLAIVGLEARERGDCRLSIPHIAALAGVSETTVRNALRLARELGLVTIEERRLTAFRSDTNIVRITSSEWSSWLRLRRWGGGCNLLNPTHTLDKRRDAPRPSSEDLGFRLRAPWP